MDDSIYRLRTQDLLALAVLSLVGMGVLMVHSAAMNVGTRWVVTGHHPNSPPGHLSTFEVDALGVGRAREWAARQEIDVHDIVPAEAFWQWPARASRHAWYALAGLLAFVLVSRINPARLIDTDQPTLRQPAVWLMIAAGLLSAAVLVPGIGTEVNGARRWIRAGPVQFQPSEIAKWATVMFVAWWVATRREQMRWFFRGLIPPMVVVAVVCLLIVIQDFGTAALIGLVAGVMLMVGGARLTHLLMIVPPALIAAAAFIVSKEYRLRRMTSFMDPFANPRDEGYHMVQSLLAFASGGASGRGLGNGVQKLGYLPEDTTDFIYAVIAEELGLIGAGFVVLMYGLILWVTWRVVSRQRDPAVAMLAFGVGAMISLQAVINIAVATVSVPTKGLSLPLVSAGGSGLIVTCAALGALCAVARAGTVRRVGTPKPAPLPKTVEQMLQVWTRAA